MDRILQLNEFFVEGGQPELSHVLLHITEPSTPEEKKKGYFFALCEINNAEGRHIVKLQNLIDEIENGYYETPDQENKTSLEVVLEKINQQNLTLLKPDLALNYVVGAIRQPEILFSYHGAPQVFIFYKNNEGVYRRMNLAETAEADERQLFSQIIQGKINPHDYFFAGTPRLADYFNGDRLEKLITSRPPRQSAEHLERVLSELKNGLSFGGLVIHLGESSAASAIHRPKPRAGNGSEKSLKSFFNTEENTANTLSPSLFRRFSGKMQSLIKDKLPQKAAPVPGRPTQTSEYAPAEIKSAHLRQHHGRPKMAAKADLKQNLSVALDIAWQMLKYLGQGLAWLAVAVFTLLKGLVTGLVLLFFVATNYQKRRQPILDDWRRAVYSYRENFKQLSPLARILMFSAIVLAFVFAISLIYLGARQRNLSLEKTYQENMRLVKTKRDLAESSIIYNDETAALSAAQEAKVLLAQLDCNARAHRDECKTISDQLENVLVKVRKVVAVKPEFLADWSNLEKDPMQLIKINSKFIAYGASSTLFTYDLLTKENKTLPAGFNNFIAGAAPKENDYALFLRSTGELIKYDPGNGSFARSDLTWPEQKSNITTLVVYNRRLYTLDALNNKIYKHDSIKTGFGQGKDWLRDNTADLTNGTSITIDGDLFALKNNGEVYKFTGGVKQPFALQGIDPALTGGDKIFTYTDLLRLYILDSAGKRLLVLNKDGKLLKQITSSQFISPTGLVVDEPQSKAYILDSGKLYQISL